MTVQIQSEISRVAKLLGRKFLFFRWYYFPHHAAIADAEFHKELSQMLERMTINRGTKHAIAAPRDSGKSTIVGAIYVIYCICYGIEEFIVLISSTSDQAANFLSHIKTEFETNEKLKRDFPEVCEIGKPPRWTRNEIVTRNNVKVLALGTGQQIRGRRNKEFRPSLIILDDIETAETSQSPENFNKLEDWVTKSVLKAGTVKTNTIYIGTIHNYNSLLAKFTSKDAYSGWNKKIYRSVISWPENPDLWQKWEAIYNYRENFEGEEGPASAEKFYLFNKEAMLKGTQLLWPQKKSFYDLMVMREQDGHYSFDSEMQNEPVNPRDCHFNLEEAHFWDDRYGSEEELITAIGENGEFYGACDPSLGKLKHRGDFTAIVTVLIDTDKGTIYVIDADIMRRLPDRTIDDILAYQERRKYQTFAFETNQFQEFMKDELEKRSNERKLYLHIQDVKHSSDKFARIETLQPLVKNGTIQFSRKHRTLLEQMKFFPKGQYDDGLDALEMAVQIAKDGGRGPCVWWLGMDD